MLPLLYFHLREVTKHGSRMGVSSTNQKGVPKQRCSSLIQVWSFGFVIGPLPSSLVNLRLGFPLVDQNVFSQLWHGLGNSAKIVVCSVWCDHVHETGDRIVLRRVFGSPGENQPLGFRPFQPRIWHYYKNEKFRMSAFYLANHFLLHFGGIFLAFHQAVSIDVTGCRMPIRIKIDLRLGA